MHMYYIELLRLLLSHSLFTDIPILRHLWHKVQITVTNIISWFFKTVILTYSINCIGFTRIALMVKFVIYDALALETSLFKETNFKLIILYLLILHLIFFQK